MFERILFPTDFSEHARMAMNCIAGLPGVKEIILLHVIESGNFYPKVARESQISQVRERLESNKSFLIHLGLHTVKTVLITSGSIADGIVSTAKKEEVSIIVMEPKSKGFIEGLHLGSITFRVLHDSSTNFLILRSHLIEGLQGDLYHKFCPQILSKVLVSIDLSTESLKVVREIVSVPGIHEMILCYSLPRGIMESEMSTARDEALTKIKTACTGIIPANIIYRVRILTGEPVKEIKEFAQESDVSLICSIPHGKGTIDEMIHGSFTCDLVTQTHHPILIYRSDQVS